MWGISLSNIRIIKTERDAKEALALLTRHKFEDELVTIRQAARTMSRGRAGMPGREQAIRAVLIGFAGNIAELGI